MYYLLIREEGASTSTHHSETTPCRRGRMINEPDMAGGAQLRRLGSNGDGGMNNNNVSASLLDEVGLASALNFAANLQRKSILSSPTKTELTTILEMGSKRKKSHQPVKRRVSFSAISVAVSDQANPQDQTTRIISLPWRVSDGTRDIDGRYTGDINLSFQPHGRGTLRFDDGKSNITGEWSNGVLFQHKHNSDGQRPAYRRRAASPTPSFEAGATSSTSLAHFGYVLGDEVKGDHHMMIPKTVTEALQNASSLNALDFAFVLRSNDSWTYAIVAEKSFHKDLGLVIRFVLDKNGTTKTIRRKYWGKGVRPVNSSSD
ncbi:hypothetical protein QTG54_015352 [Skeletonema marinoi]|uniref:Uncharacterized protein n=1 Tax=Skeletonema marinoi TaxID=267567 RepID=A0AAD8XUE4_9STRA|nr:hypothetical protein QTG54_015352 [Skeletonema marinoi]